MADGIASNENLGLARAEFESLMLRVKKVVTGAGFSVRTALSHTNKTVFATGVTAT